MAPRFHCHWNHLHVTWLLCTFRGVKVYPEPAPSLPSEGICCYGHLCNPVMLRRTQPLLECQEQGSQTWNKILLKIKENAGLLNAGFCNMNWLGPRSMAIHHYMDGILIYNNIPPTCCHISAKIYHDLTASAWALDLWIMTPPTTFKGATLRMAHRSQSVWIFSILIHPCFCLVYYYLFGVFLPQ